LVRRKDGEAMTTKHSYLLLLLATIILGAGLVSCSSTAPAPTSTAPAKTTPTKIPNSVKTATPANTWTPTHTPKPVKTTTPDYSPTNTLIAKLAKLATLGEGILPQIVYSHDGTKIFTSDGYRVQILDSSNHNYLGSFEISDEGYGRIAAISLDDSLIIIDAGVGFGVMEISTQEEIARGFGGNGPAVSPIFTNDSRYVLYRAADRIPAGPQNRICRLDLNNLEPTEEYENCYKTVELDRNVEMTNPAVSPNGRIVAAGYTDSTQNILYLWDVRSKKILHEINGIPSYINSVAFNQDGSTLVTAGADGLVRFWDPDTGKIKRSIAAFTNDIQHVEFSQDGRQLIVRVTDQPAIMYDIATGKTGASTPEPLDPLAKQMLQDGYMLSGGGSRICFSPDGRSLAIGHGSIQIWDLETRKLKTTLYGEQALEIAGMTYSRDSRHLAAVTRDGDVYTWDIGSGEKEFFASARTLADVQVYFALVSSGIGPGIGATPFGEKGLAFSPDASEIAISNGRAVELWDIGNSQKLLTFEQTQPPAFPTKITFSPNGELVYAALNRNQDIAVWNVKTGELIRQLDLPAVDPNAFTATDLQSSWFARNNYNETDYWIELWNLESGKMIKIPTFQIETEPLRFSADGLFLGALINHDRIYIWRTDTGQLAFVSDGGFDIGDFALDKDGILLATAKYGKATLWDWSPFASAALQPGFISLAMPATPTPWSSETFDFPTETPQPTLAVDLLPVPTSQPGAISRENASNLQLSRSLGLGRVNHIAWSEDGRSARVTSSKGVYNLGIEELKATKRFETDALWVTSSQKVEDGRILAAGWTNDNKIQVWDTSSQIMLVELKGSGEPAISPDGRWLVYEVDEGLQTWNLESSQEGTILLSQYYVYWPVFSPNSRYVAAIQSDRSIRVWDVETGVIVTAAGGPEADITDLSFSPDGNYLIGAAGGTAWVWSMAPSLQPVKVNLFAGVVDYNLTLFQDSVTAATTTEDNSLLAIGTSERKIVLYNRKTGKTIGILEGLASFPVNMAFSPDGTRLLSVDNDGQISLWKVAERRMEMKMHEFGGKIAGLTLGPDGNIAALMQNTVWSISPQDASLKHSAYIPAKNILAASPAGNLVAGYTHLKVSLYDAQSGELKQTLPDEVKDIFVEYYYEGEILRQFYGAVFSPDGKRLATFGAGGMWLYNLPATEGKYANSFDGFTRKAAISGDGEWLIASPYELSYTPGLTAFDTGEEILDFAFQDSDYSYGSGADYTQYAFSPDKRWVGMLKLGRREPSKLELVDTSTGTLVQAFEFEEPLLLCLAFNPSGSLIAVGQGDGSVTLVDTTKMEVLTSFEAHSGAITSLVFSTDGSILISGGEDGVVKMWGVP
jgi:WD40 repeat protein